MASRDENLKKAKERERELQKERERIRAAIPKAPHDAKKPLERAVRVTQRILAKVRERISHLKPGPKVMYDSIDLAQFPSDPPAVAGYTSGFWPTYPELVKRFPKAKHLSIAVTAAHDADCLDIETGDATPEQAPAWVRAQKKRGVERPCVYASLSSISAVLAALEREGISRDEVRVFTAHYTGKAHLCSPGCGFGFKTNADATQFTDHALGRNLDESRLRGGFFG